MNEENLNHKFYKIYLLFAFAMTVVAVIAQTLVMKGFYSPSEMLWAKDIPVLVPYIAPIIIIVLMLTFATIFIMIEKNTLPEEIIKQNNIVTKIGSSICALSLIATLVFQFVFRNTDDHLVSFLTKGTAEYNGTVAYTHIASLILALFACIYFIYDFVNRKKHAVFGIILLAWMTVYTLRLYFDITVMLENPRRVLSLLAACFAILYIVLEIRYFVGRPSPRVYILFAFGAMITCAMSGFSSIILTATGFLDYEIQTYYHVFEAAFAVYVGTRLFLYACDIKMTSQENESLPDTEPEQTPQDELDDASSEESVEAPENTKEEKEPDNDDNGLSKEELKDIFNYISTSVAQHTDIVFESEIERSEHIKHTTFKLIAKLLENDEQRDERINAIREMIVKSNNKDVQINNDNNVNNDNSDNNVNNVSIDSSKAADETTGQEYTDEKSIESTSDKAAAATQVTADITENSEASDAEEFMKMSDVAELGGNDGIEHDELEDTLTFVPESDNSKISEDY